MENWTYKPAADLGLSLKDRLRSYQRECGLIETGAHHVWWSAIRAYLAVCHRLTIEGRRNLPHKPPFVIVANHSSHLDTLVLASLLPARLRDHIFPLAAGDTFFERPLTAAFSAGVLNALPMWRQKFGSHALHELRQRLLDEPCSYILFPEGTRSRDGCMKPFKSGLGMLVAGTHVPVVPCYLEGAFQAFPPHRKLPRFARIHVRIGEPLDFASATNDRAGWDNIARTTEAAVRDLAAV